MDHDHGLWIYRRQTNMSSGSPSCGRRGYERCGATADAGVIGHRVPLEETRVIHGFIVVRPEDAWLQLAPIVAVDDLVVVGDHLVNRKRPLTSLESIRIEYEGEVHRTDQRTFDHDIDRRERFEAAGWRVIRVRARHLGDPRALTERVRIALIERGARF